MSIEPAGASSAEVAAAIARTATPALNLTPGIPPVGRAYGVVVSIQTGPPPTLTLTLGGSQKPIAGIRYMGSYSPTVGDTVLLDHVGTDLVVRGGLAKVLSGTPAGTLAYAQVITNQAGIGTGVTDITGLSVGPLTIPTGRRLRITGFSLCSGITASVMVFMYIMDNGVQIGEFLISAAGSYQTCQALAVLVPSAGTHSYKIQMRVSSGTLQVEASPGYPAFILVEDVGAA